MNFPLLSKFLGIISLLIGVTMSFSLIWAVPALGHRHAEEALAFETSGMVALAASIAVCAAAGGALMWFGRHSSGPLYRKEAMAIVGLSWILATIVGALPFYFSGTCRSASVRLMGPEQQPQVFRLREWFCFRQQWRIQDKVSEDQHRILEKLLQSGARGLARDELIAATGLAEAPEHLERLANSNRSWQRAIILPDQEKAPADRKDHYRVRWVSMGIVDSLFESQSGFSTTGATVISDLEDPVLVPHCILFWRSSTHFLGGLGIIVVFVVIVGQGAAGKALMRAEMPGPTKEGATARMQHTAWLVAAIYSILNMALATILWFLGLTPFDALCHAFGTMATGGFSTYNQSVGHFQSPVIDFVIIVFMILAGSNFTLLYFLFVGRPGKLLRDVEWRTYMTILVGVSLLVLAFGLLHGDFEGDGLPAQLATGIRYGSFQVVSIMTTTGYSTHDFDRWNSFGRGVLFLLMFVGGCASSTGGGLKVIRHILLWKILGLQVEQSYRPSVVRPLRLGGKSIDDPDIRRAILVYFALILVIFVFSWMIVVTVEPDITWGTEIEHKLIDSASGVAATINNIGPGLGTVGATQTYGHFSPLTKLLFVWLMMVGRLEIFAVLVLFMPGFWRRH